MNNKIEGIVLRQNDYRDSDIILSVFTRENGKMSFLARGLKKPQSKNASSCNLFCHSLFHYSDNGKDGMKILKNAERKCMFYHIYEDLLKQSCAQLICECIDKMLDGSSEELFDVLYKSLNYLNEGKDPMLILSLFLAHANEYCGITPNVDECVRCHSQKNIASISLREGGFVCINCMDHLYHTKYSETELRNFRLIHKARIDDFEVLSKHVSASYKDVKLVLSFFEEYSGIHLKSSAFLEKIVEM